PYLNSDIDIQGPGANVLAVRRNTGGYYDIFSVALNATVTLSGLTLTNGNAPVLGGGVYNGGTLALSNCTLSENTAVHGGGIYNESTGTLKVSNCTLSDNTATFKGGGIFNHGTLELSNSILSTNM